MSWVPFLTAGLLAGRSRVIAPASETPARWDEPYLETCCRSALHRVWLAGELGRPDGLKDGQCLARLARFGFVIRREDDRCVLSPAGADRHQTEVLRGAGRRRRGRVSAD